MSKIKKFKLFYESKKYSPDISDELMGIDCDARDFLGINSANPIYDDKIVRRRYINYIDRELEKYDLDRLIKDSNKIIDVLENEGYYVLMNFLIVRRYIHNKRRYEYLLRKLDDKGYTDREFIQDLVEY